MKKILILITSIVLLFSCNKENQIGTNNTSVDFSKIPLNDPVATNDSLASKFKSFGRNAVDISKKIARVNYVVDYDLYTQLGSNEVACSTYVNKNHNLAMKAYEPFNIFTKIVRIEIFKVPSVYTPLTNIYSILNAFNNNYYLLPGVDCNILLFAKPLGGVAFIGGVNSTSGRSLVCGVYPQDTYFNHFLIAHELGHYFGSNHTHDCWKFPDGKLRRIDSCFAGCNQTNTKFTTGGTVMSYCYNRGTIKLPLEFHPFCKDTMVKTLAKNTSIPADGVVVVPPTPPSTTMTIDTVGKLTAKQGFKLSRDGIFTTNASRWVTTGACSITFNNVNKNITTLTLHTGWLSGSTWTSPVKSIQVIVNGVIFYTTTTNNLTTLNIPINANTTSLRILFRDTDNNRVREIIF